VTSELLICIGGIRTPPVDVESLVKCLGVSVIYKDSVEVSRLEVNGNQATIVVNSNASKQRQRFALAHELGHLLRHDLTKPTCHYDFRGHAAIEREANIFAASLLMPRSMLGLYLGYTSLDLDQIGRVFDVPRTTCEYRVAHFLRGYRDL
jgi:Zn-dependent peptidase ImmA (M78 family)